MGASSNKGGMGGPNTRAPGGGGMDYNGNPVGGGMGAQFNFGGPGNNLQGRSLPGNMFRGAGNLFGGAIDRSLNRPQPGQPLPPGVSKGFGMPPPQQQQQPSGREPQFQGMPDEMYNRMKADEAVDAANPNGARTGEYKDYYSWQEDHPYTAPAPVNRFQPQGMIPPAGGRPQPGQMTGPNTRQRYPSGDPRRYANQGGVPGGGPQPGAPTPMPSPPMRGKGGGGKGGMPGPGGPRMIGGPFNPGGGFQPQIDPMDRFQNGGLPDRADGLDPYS